MNKYFGYVIGLFLLIGCNDSCNDSSPADVNTNSLVESTSAKSSSVENEAEKKKKYTFCCESNTHDGADCTEFKKKSELAVISKSHVDSNHSPMEVRDKKGNLIMNFKTMKDVLDFIENENFSDLENDDEK